MKHALLTALLLLQVQAGATPVEGKLIAHEWGTFTSVQGSNGEALGGMNHEEEELPAFVVKRDLQHQNRHCPKIKGQPICDDDFAPGSPLIRAADVTQKMETPVLYFHSDRERQMQVDVSFPGGLISQYYPQPTMVEPRPGFAFNLSNGFARFLVNLKTQPLTIPAVEENSVYRPAREVDANFLSSGSENEKFIFYRGLGKFTTSVHVNSIGGSLAIRNTGPNPVPAAFLLNIAPNGGAFVRPLGSIESSGSVTVTLDEMRALKAKNSPNETVLIQASEALVEALVNSGLYQDEARAMANTWKNSYFRSPGLRVLYLLSRPETEALLPMTINPPPQELVRTLVGRIEVLTDLEESTMLSQLTSYTLQPQSLGRFAEPKLRRLLQLSHDSATLNKINALIRQVQ